MPFTFRLHDPPCDVAFLSIVDGEALYTADNARTRDVKEATIRQIGWHRVQLPQDWFLSHQALETVTHVLEAMQCTVQYLRYRCKNEEKRNCKLSASLQHCEEERAAAFEELIELREQVALYKKQLREVSQGVGRRGVAAALNTTQHARQQTPPAASTGLQCAFCENVYPSRHALESHFRKRHKRPPGYAAMAAASAAVAQQLQQQQDVPASELDGAASLPAHSTLPFMSQGLSVPSQREMTKATAASSCPSTPLATLDSRGTQALREELSELRLAVAKLLTQQAEFYRGMAPTSLAAVPMPSAESAVAPPSVSRAPPAPPCEKSAPRTSEAGQLPGFPPSVAATNEDGDVVLRIPHELLHTSPELRLLQNTLGRHRARSSASASDTAARSEQDAHRTSSPPPRDGGPQEQPPALPTRPTLDPRSFLRSSTSDSVLYGVTSAATAAVAGSRRRSNVDSFIEVSPMSPSPSPAQRAGSVQEEHHDGAVAARPGNHASSARSPLSSSAATYASHRPLPVSSAVVKAARASDAAEAQGGSDRKVAVPSPHPSHSSPHALTGLSDYSSLRDDLTISSNGRTRVGATQSPLSAGVTYRAVRASADSGRAKQGPEFDSPMVRLPSSSDAQTAGSAVDPESPSANRYALPLSEEASSQRTPAASPSSQRLEQGRSGSGSGVVRGAPPPAAVAGAGSAALARPQDMASSLFSKKTYGPVPSVPVLRASPPNSGGGSSSSSDSLPPTNTRQSTTSMHPTSVAHTRAGIDEPQAGMRSPTQTPHRANTPPTSRAAQVPALDLSSVSLHGSRENHPPRSASPPAQRATQKRSTTKDSRGVHESGGDAVMVGERLQHSSSSGLQAGFAPAAQAPTQKTIPVVRLVPAAPSDSVELAQQDEMEAVDADSNGSAPSFTNAELNSGRAYSDAPLMKTQPARRPTDVRVSSDASYSVEAQPFDEEDEDEEPPDELNAGVYEVWHGGSRGSLHDDIDVEEGMSNFSSNHDAGSDPVMEDVLTDDNLVQAPLFETSLAAYPAARASQPSSAAESFLQEVGEAPEHNDDDDEERYAVEEVEEGNQRIYLSEDAIARMQSGGDVDEEHTGERNAYPKNSSEAVQEQEEGVSGDYSYYSYSYSDGVGESEEDREEGSHALPEASPSMEALEVPPPMAASLNATISVAAVSASETHEDVALPDATRGRKGKEKAARPPAATSAMPATLQTPLTGKEEVGAMHQTHDESFQSNLSNTVKKAGGVFKSLFKGKKK